MDRVEQIYLFYSGMNKAVLVIRYYSKTIVICKEPIIVFGRVNEMEFVLYYG